MLWSQKTNKFFGITCSAMVCDAVTDDSIVCLHVMTNEQAVVEWNSFSLPTAPAVCTWLLCLSNHLPRYTLSLLKLISVSTHSFALSKHQMLCITLRTLILYPKVSLHCCSNCDKISMWGRPQGLSGNWETGTKAWSRTALSTKPITKTIHHYASLKCNIRLPLRCFDDLLSVEWSAWFAFSTLNS